MRTMKKLSEKITELGGQSAFSKLVGVNPQSVWNWLNRDKQIPAEYVVRIEEITGIPCWEIRPDVFTPKRFKKA